LPPWCSRRRSYPRGASALAGQLGLEQSRLSEIERGDVSFTAEQFVAILKLFNVPPSHFASGAQSRRLRATGLFGVVARKSFSLFFSNG